MTFGRRAVDIVLALLGLLILFPFLFLFSLLIWLEDGRPILFIQERVGRGGKKFPMFKLRTMRVNSGAKGLQITVGQDPRITRVGYWLRKTKFDEFPQLLNVLRGEMTFVGPRPEVERYVNQYTPDQRRVLDLVPGITDPASLKYYNESELLGVQEDPERHYVEVIMPDKIRINLDYQNSRSMGADLSFIVATLSRVFGGHR